MHAAPQAGVFQQTPSMRSIEVSTGNFRCLEALMVPGAVVAVYVAYRGPCIAALLVSSNREFDAYVTTWCMQASPESSRLKQIPGMFSNEVPGSSSGGAGLMLRHCTLLATGASQRTRSLICDGGRAPQPRCQPASNLWAAASLSLDSALVARCGQCT